MSPLKRHVGAPAPAKPPPLLPTCGDDGLGRGLAQDDFRALFDYLYVDGHWYASVPGRQALRICFRPHHFAHAFFKEAEPGTPRTLWQRNRAQRLLWIGFTIENPTQVRLVGASRVNLFCRMADREAPWYLVVVESVGEWVANFVTAYPVGHGSYAGLQQIGRPPGP